MFLIEQLWTNEKLAPLKKAYDADRMDRRLVVAIDDSGSVNIAETESLHAWLEKQNYQRIPGDWETEELESLQVIHVSNLSLEVLRRDPFSATPTPLAPNSWLNRLPQERFDALLLAQVQGDVAMQPTRMEIKDAIKPALEAETLTAFWAGVVADVQFCKSGQAPKNSNQKKLLSNWRFVEQRRHYDPTAGVQPAPTESGATPVARVVRQYVWSDECGNQYRWNKNMTVLRDWIEAHVRDSSDLRICAMQIFGTSAHVQFTGSIRNDAHDLVSVAMRRDKLSDLAAYYDFDQELAMGGSNQPSVPSPFSQTVYGQQVNIGNINASGDFVGRDKYSVFIGGGKVK